MYGEREGRPERLRRRDGGRPEWDLSGSLLRQLGRKRPSLSSRPYSMIKLGSSCGGLQRNIQHCPPIPSVLFYDVVDDIRASLERTVSNRQQDGLHNGQWTPIFLIFLFFRFPQNWASEKPTSYGPNVKQISPL